MLTQEMLDSIKKKWGGHPGLRIVADLRRMDADEKALTC